MKIKLIYLLLFTFSLIELTNSIIIKTSYGSLNGATVHGPNGQEYHTFKKVPFAQAPIGALRFAPPLPPLPWNQTIDATKYGPACMSNSTQTRSIQKWVDEDCLHANIFTSSRCLKSKNCPVVFYLHGGGLHYDSAVMFNDTVIIQNFASNDVVMVIAAFRLGIFSHVIFDNQNNIPANTALYDNIRALEFVHQEISNFGGDNTKVTLLGHSFGGGQIAALVFNEKFDPEKRLFQRAISMSPSFVFDDTEGSIKNTWIFANRTQCTPPSEINGTISQDSKEKYVIDCLRKVDQHELLRIQRQLEEEKVFYKGFVQVEPLFHGQHVQDFLKTSRKVPLVIGTTIHEFDHSTTKQNVAEYLGFDNPSEIYDIYHQQKRDGLLKFNHSEETQGTFVGALEQAQHVSQSGADVYLYSYSNPKHAIHTDDLFYIMGVHPFEMDSNEKVLSKLYLNYFINFIKHGNPDEKWNPLIPKVNNYFSIDVNIQTGLRPEIKLRYENEVIKYWNVDMKLMDKKISLTKLKAQIEEESPFKFRSFGNLTKAPKNAQMYSAFVLSAIFVIGILLGRYICPSKSKNGQILVDEKTPLIVTR